MGITQSGGVLIKHSPSHSHLMSKLRLEQMLQKLKLKINTRIAAILIMLIFTNQQASYNTYGYFERNPGWAALCQIQWILSTPQRGAMSLRANETGTKVKLFMYVILSARVNIHALQTPSQAPESKASSIFFLGP